MKLKRIIPAILSSLMAFSFLSATESKAPEAIEVVEIDNYYHTKNFLSLTSNNNPDVQKQAAAFFDELQKAQDNGKISFEDAQRVLEGVRFSAEKHQYQVRKNPEKTPYIIHPIGVAYNLMTIDNVSDPDILLEALLHDTVGDTNTHQSK